MVGVGKGGIGWTEEGVEEGAGKGRIGWAEEDVEECEGGEYNGLLRPFHKGI